MAGISQQRPCVNQVIINLLGIHVSFWNEQNEIRIFPYPFAYSGGAVSHEATIVVE